MDAARLLKALTAETHELCGSVVERLPAPTPLQFLRRFVATNTPCIVTGASADWPCFQRWASAEALERSAGGDSLVTVSLTPTGRADAVAIDEKDGERVFALPCEERWPLSRVLEALRSPDAATVPYVSAQDGSLTRDFPSLLDDVPASVPFAEGLGPAEAVNFWLGDSRSQTTFHADPYENLYAVVAGEKRFLLLPPADAHRLYLTEHPVARYARSEDGRWTLERQQAPPVAWSPIDPFPTDREAAEAAFPLYWSGPPPLEVLLKPGEILYLPSGWWHHVSQSDFTVAVNWWHDGVVGHSHALRELAAGVAAALLRPPRCAPPPAVSEPECADAVEETRRSWNFATRQHNAHKRDQASHLLAEGTLFPEEREMLGELRGQSVLHLLCNSGQDSLSMLAHLGAARVTGVDVSDEAVEMANALARNTGLAAKFVRSEVQAWLEAAPECSFDVVFGSYGFWGWLADVPRLLRGVHRVLRPGGRFVSIDFHPLVWSFDSELRFCKDDYFASKPFRDPVNDYVGAAGGALSPSGHIDFPSEPNPHSAVGWQHTAAELVNAIVASRLRPEGMAEHAHCNGARIVPGLVEAPGRRFVVPGDGPSPPLMLALTARREPIESST